MEYVITFLEGVISFISPCTLPLLPVYIVYLTGGQHAQGNSVDAAEAGSKRSPGRLQWSRPLGFVLGFTVVFCLLGLFAGALGSLLARHQTAVNIVCGIAVIGFGLMYLGVIPVRFLKGMNTERSVTSFLSAVVFGVIYSVSLTPCVGAFLGSAIMLAAASGTALKGAVLLLVYSAGLGLPFLVSALLIEQLTDTFNAIKRHYAAIDRACGIFLIAVGIAMACGWMNRLIALLA